MSRTRVKHICIKRSEPTLKSLSLGFYHYFGFAFHSGGRPELSKVPAFLPGSDRFCVVLVQAASISNKPGRRICCVGVLTHIQQLYAGFIQNVDPGIYVKSAEGGFFSARLKTGLCCRSCFMSTPFPLANQPRILRVCAVPSSPKHAPSQPRSLTAMRLLPGELPSSKQWSTQVSPGSLAPSLLPPPSQPPPTPPPPGPGRPLRTFSCSLTAGMQQNHKGSSL